MGLLNKKPPEQSDGKSDLVKLTQARIDAAGRLDRAIVEIEAATGGLIAADDAFFSEVRSSGASDHGSAGHLRRVLRTLVVGQMQVAAPDLLRVLGIPYLPATARGSIAEAVRRTGKNDLSNFAPEKEDEA